MRHNKELKAALLHLGYGVSTIRNNYIENMGTIGTIDLNENCFFVVNRNDDECFMQRIFELSEYFNQNCFLFKPKGTMNAFNVYTNFSEYPGYKNEEYIGEFNINIEDKILSRIDNSSFSFFDVIKMDLYENYQYGARHTIASIHENINLNHNKLKIHNLKL